MSEVANIPQLRFSEFSGEWEEKKLGELCKFTQGVQIPFSEQLTKYKEGAIRYLYIRDFFTDDFPYYVKDQYPNKVIHTDEIMMVNTGNTAGKAFMGATGVLSNNAFKVSFDKTKVSNIFLFQRITSDTIQRRIKSFFNAGGQPHLGHKNIAIIPMGFASLKEQQKIAAFLTAVDNKIEQLSKKKALLGEYKKGLMQQIFSQAIRFKADDGSAFPVWEEKKLGDIGHTFNGLTGKTKDDFGRGKPYIQYMQIFESSKINIDNFGLVDVRDDENQKVAQYGDVFFTTSSETPDAVGYSSVLLDDIDKLYLNSFCFGFRPNSIDELSPNFAQFLLRSAHFRRRVVRLAQGSTRYNMSKVQLMKEVISLPCLKEQTKIANFLSSIDSKIEQVSKQLDESKQFKKALLQQMFV